MDIYTKMAYLKGMLEGMDFEDKKEKKLFAAMIDILDELVEQEELERMAELEKQLEELKQKRMNK